MCVAVVALIYKSLFYFYVLLLLSLSIVQLRLSTPNKVYDDDDGNDDQCWRPVLRSNRKQDT